MKMVAFGSLVFAGVIGYLQFHYHGTVSAGVVVWAALSAVGVSTLKGSKR